MTATTKQRRFIVQLCCSHLFTQNGQAFNFTTFSFKRYTCRRTKQKRNISLIFFFECFEIRFEIVRKLTLKKIIEKFAVTHFTKLFIDALLSYFRYFIAANSCSLSFNTFRNNVQIAFWFLNTYTRANTHLLFGFCASIFFYFRWSNGWLVFFFLLSSITYPVI